jgi:predicted aspartyl protease
MITGTVNADFEPIIPLSVRRADGEVFTQEAIVDTGFNGWLSLPPEAITELNLRWKRRGRAILGDGSECVFNLSPLSYAVSCHATPPESQSVQARLVYPHSL